MERFWTGNGFDDGLGSAKHGTVAAGGARCARYGKGKAASGSNSAVRFRRGVDAANHRRHGLLPLPAAADSLGNAVGWNAAGDHDGTDKPVSRGWSQLRIRKECPGSSQRQRERTGKGARLSEGDRSDT